MKSWGRRAISWRSPTWRAISLPAVTRTVPTNAPEMVRIPPTTSMASNSTPMSSVYCFGFVLPTACTRSAPATETIAMLSVQAVQRGQNRSMPMAGAAISSSRVAMAKRPTRVSRNSETTTSAPATATQSQTLEPWRGTPDSPPAPRVSSCQFLTTESTTNRTASVIIVAAMPVARATAMPTTAPMAVATTTAMTVAASEPTCTSSMPKGRSGSEVAFVATGMVTSAAP